MGLKLFKPINILDSVGYWPERGAIIDSITELLTLGGLKRPLPVRDFGRYRDPNWRDENNALRPYQSSDWFISTSMNEDRFQVNGKRLLETFENEPWRREDLLGDHYDVFVMAEDMFLPQAGDMGGRYSVGEARPLVGAVVSTHRIDSMWGDPYSYLKTELMRQLCFMFGLPGKDRDDVKECRGKTYCKNTCILRHAHNAPADWERMTFDRLRNGPLCKSCQRDLKSFFAVAEKEYVADNTGKLFTA